jgi:hypothetical protein
MRMVATTLTLVGALTLSLTAMETPAGKWKAVFTIPVAEQPKTFAEALLDLTVKDKTITGTVTMGDWPGVCRISEGQIDGDSFSFIATGALWSSSGYPQPRFDGTIEAGVMKLTLTWRYEGQARDGRKMTMEAKRVPPRE